MRAYRDTHQNVHVHKVLRALGWLRDHSWFYTGIQLNSNHTIPTTLLDDGNILDGVEVVIAAVGLVV